MAKRRKDMPEAVKITNFDRKLGSFKNKKGINLHFLMPKWPFRMIICSPTAGGKSNLCLNLICNEGLLHFDKLFVFARHLGEDKWRYIKDFRDKMQEKINEAVEECPQDFPEKMDDISIFSEDLNDMPKLGDLDDSEQTLIIFDDWVNVQDQKLIEDYFIMSRKANVSCIYMTQMFHKCPDFIKTQSSHVAVFKLGNKRCLTELSKTFSGRVGHKRFMEIFKEATQKPYSFLFIDKNTDNDHLHLRCGFDKLLITPDNPI